MQPVPGLHPGMTPTMLLHRMKKNMVAMKGKCLRQVSPSSALQRSSRQYSTRNSTPLTKRPLGTTPSSACFFLKVKITARRTMMATHIQNEYWVTPTLRSPTTGVEEKLLTSSSISSGSLSSGFTTVPFSRTSGCVRIPPCPPSLDCPNEQERGRLCAPKEKKLRARNRPDREQGHHKNGEGGHDARESSSDAHRSGLP